MVKIHEVDEETVLLELEPTKYYQLWNIWDLYSHLAKGEKKMTFEVEDFPIHIDTLSEYAKELKTKQNNN
jgi:hypothetical protein